MATELETKAEAARTSIVVLANAVDSLRLRVERLERMAVNQHDTISGLLVAQQVAMKAVIALQRAAAASGARIDDLAGDRGPTDAEIDAFMRSAYTPPPVPPAPSPMHGSSTIPSQELSEEIRRAVDGADGAGGSGGGGEDGS